LTRTVVNVSRSRRNTSATAFVSFATMFVASERKATKRPKRETTGEYEAPFPCARLVL